MKNAAVIANVTFCICACIFSVPSIIFLLPTVLPNFYLTLLPSEFSFYLSYMILYAPALWLGFLIFAFVWRHDNPKSNLATLWIFIGWTGMLLSVFVLLRVFMGMGGEG